MFVAFGVIELLVIGLLISAIWLWRSDSAREKLKQTLTTIYPRRQPVDGASKPDWTHRLALGLILTPILIATPLFLANAVFPMLGDPGPQVVSDGPPVMRLTFAMLIAIVVVIAALVAAFRSRVVALTLCVLMVIGALLSVSVVRVRQGGIDSGTTIVNRRSLELTELSPGEIVSSQSTRQIPDPAAGEPVPAADSQTPPLSISERVFGIDPNGEMIESRALSELPLWTQNKAGFRGLEHWQEVLTSERYATLEEAESDIIAQLKSMTQQYLAETHSEMAGWDVPPRLLEALLVRQRVDVIYPLQVGGFTEQVHQIHVDAELMPRIHQEMLSIWRPEEVNRRLQILGWTAGCVTLLLAAGAFRHRHKV